MMKWGKYTISTTKDKIYVRIKGEAPEEKWSVTIYKFLSYAIGLTLYNNGLPAIDIWPELPEKLKEFVNTDLNCFEVENSIEVIEEFTNILNKWLKEEVEPLVYKEVETYDADDDWIIGIYKL